MSESKDREKDAPLLERLADAQHAHPWRFIGVAFALGLAAMPFIYGIPGFTDGLTLNSDFTAMLPESAQSVRDLAEIQERFGGQQAMTLAIESQNGDVEELHRFTRAFVARVEQLEEHKVAAVDWNISDFATFVEDNRHLYADLEDLEAVRDALHERLDYDRARANPFFLDLDDEAPPPDPEPVVRRIEQRAERARQDAERRFPEGFLQHPTESVVIMVVHTRIREAGETDALVVAIESVIDDLDPDDHIRVYWGGTLIEVRDETASLTAEVFYATLLTVAFVLLAIYIFFLRIRPIPLLSLGLVPPILVTFAVAELTVDYLNASSAFLASIVVGNGINPQVIWLSRYFEVRRAGESVRTALITSHRGTWKGTLTASLAAGVAYGSLMSTDYRGFRDFGVVGGSGMVFCWIATFLLLPALSVAFERIKPLTFKAKAAQKGIYGVIFARLAIGSAKPVLMVSVLITLVTGAVVGVGIAQDPMEYDFRKLRSIRDPDSDPEKVLRFSQEILTETLSGSALAVLASSREEAIRMKRQLDERRDEFPEAYGEVRTIDDLLPADQEAKIPVLRELREIMLDIRPHVSAELQALIDAQIPPEAPRALGPDDLPRSIARPYTERDGTRGRLFFVEHHPNQNAWDGQYLGRWSEAARSIREAGADDPPPVAGTAVVFSDVMETVWEDGPRAIAIAFLATVLLLIVTFREQRQRWLTLLSLLVGVLWMAGTMALFGMRLNFLNFVAFPITFGNGVDYAVNVMRRYADEREEGRAPIASVKEAVEGTGGAVILCSLTTVIGYFSLHVSSNQALNSFGEATAIGEITCLAAAVLALPALLYLLARREEARAGKAPSGRDARAAGV